jgi:hypothetical protein
MSVTQLRDRVDGVASVTDDPRPGVQLLGTGEVEVSIEKVMSRGQIHSLIEDLIEAEWNARGYESHRIVAEEVREHDRIDLFGEQPTILSVLRELGDRVCIQWMDDGAECEITMPADLEVTVYRPIE